MIRKFCVVGDPGAIVEQLKEMERRGVKQLMCNFPLERGYQMVQDYSRNIIRRM
jgi:alkanesulfonate monooxygenase SsuD/methylene tetrahydromethanopterin reductase-like flavin-dependent oxidoreductase (luciferase family)